MKSVFFIYYKLSSASFNDPGRAPHRGGPLYEVPPEGVQDWMANPKLRENDRAIISEEEFSLYEKLAAETTHKPRYTKIGSQTLRKVVSD